MPKKSNSNYTSASLKRYVSKVTNNLKHPLSWFKNRGWVTRILSIFLALVFISILFMYSIAQWYIISQRNKPIVFGTTFVPNYAKYFGLSPQKTLKAIIDELGVKHFRLVSYWDDIEKSPGNYDFNELDWQFEMTRQAGASVSLSIGLRQPRWPECHMPGWAMKLPKEQWYADLKDFMRATINRYKSQTNLESYQLENEYFLKVFGLCKDFSRDRLIDEFNFVKSLDPARPTIISRSNNWVGLPIGRPTPDEFGISVYKRVWDKTVTKRYVEYPYPAWYYAFYAGAGKILTGKNLMIHELQAEPWVPEGYDLRTAPTEEQYKSMNPERLKDRFEYGRATGMKSIDLWGAEWWYYRKVSQHDSSLWDVAKAEFGKN